MHDLPIGQVITSDQHVILHVDDAYLAIIGRDRSEMVGRHALSFTFSDDLDRVRPMLDRLAACGQSFATTKRDVRGDGSLQWVSNHASMVRDAGERVVLCTTCKPFGRPFGDGGLARNYYVARQLCVALDAGRAALGSDVVAAPAAEALLRLYKAEMEGVAVVVRDLANDSNTALPVMIRWVRHLIDRDLIVSNDGSAVSAATVIRIGRGCEIALESVFHEIAR
jgi:PAS domain S-box-containing protein